MHGSAPTHGSGSVSVWAVRGWLHHTGTPRSDRRARDGYCSLSAPAPRPPAAAIAAVVATAIAAVVATAIAAVIALDNRAGRGRRRGGYHYRLSRSGFGHSHWCGGNSYRGSASRQHWCD